MQAIGDLCIHLGDSQFYVLMFKDSISNCAVFREYKSDYNLNKFSCPNIKFCTCCREINVMESRRKI